MDSLLIKGGIPLHGEVTISGAKNAVLPILAATLLTREPCTIRRVPDLSDVKFMGQILTSLGAEVRFEGSSMTVQAAKIKGVGDYDLIRKMRGPSAFWDRSWPACTKRKSRCRAVASSARVRLICISRACAHSARKSPLKAVTFTSRPPNCAATNCSWGAGRPHRAGHGQYHDGRHLAEGVTIIESAACEPEVIDLASFLKAMGAKIAGVQPNHYHHGRFRIARHQA